MILLGEMHGYYRSSDVTSHLHASKLQKFIAAAWFGEHVPEFFPKGFFSGFRVRLSMKIYFL